jgi:hypothetical protein
MALEVMKMATSLEELEKRIEALERIVGSSRQETRDLPKDPAEWTREDVITFLRSRGVQIGELPAEAIALAKEWDDLPEEDKAAHRAYMDSLNLDPPLSEIIIRNRR